MFKVTLFQFSAALLIFAATSVSWAQMPPLASVQRVEIDGSGCEAGSANALITSDLNFLSVLYDRFGVEIGKGTANPGAKSAEKKCSINVVVLVPAGWNFTFESVDYRGFVQLPNKMALAYQLISAEVGGGRGIGFDQNIMRGPKTENFVTTVRNKGLAALGNPTANPLDKLLGLGNALGNLKNGVGSLMGCSNQNQEVRIKIQTIIGIRNLLAELTKPAVRLTVDSTDASFRQNLKLAWKQCQ